MVTRQKIQKREDWIAKAVLGACVVLSMAILVFVVGYILVRGLPVVNLNFLLGSPENMGRSGGIYPMLLGTIVLTAVSVLIAAPLGIGTAIFLSEYTREGFISRAVRFGTESLAGIPSIIYGLFGFIFFVTRLNMGWSIISGALTLAMMMLPTIVRTSEEAIRAVPDAYREISFSLGASRWQTVTSLVIPDALPGIMSGVILALGRAVGETAAVVFTAGSSLRLPHSIFDPVRTLPVHFYILAREGLSVKNAYGTAAVLLIAVLLVNIASYALMGRMVRKRNARKR